MRVVAGKDNTAGEMVSFGKLKLYVLLLCQFSAKGESYTHMVSKVVKMGSAAAILLLREMVRLLATHQYFTRINDTTLRLLIVWFRFFYVVGIVLYVGGRCSTIIDANDRIRIETPGGGGYGVE